MIACINPGHCPGIDPGAVGPTGIKEADVVRKVGEKTRKYLLAAGVDVVLVQDDSLEKICYFANGKNVDVFISLHCNAAESSQANGTEIFTSKGQTNADFLGKCIMRQFTNTFPDIYVRGDYSDGDVDKEANFYVLKNTNMPAVLFEIAFITNDFEEQFLANEMNQEEIAKAIARGVTDYQIKMGIA